jgi:type 2 lantibiotic biosynthesis protein LanM
VIAAAPADMPGHVADIARRAMFLFERLQMTPSPDAPDHEAAARLDQLRQTVGGGDEPAFRRWLDWNSLTIDRVLSAMRDPPALPDPPPWAETLVEFLAVATDPAARHAVPARLAAEPRIPFEDLLAPALPVARRKLLDRLDGFDATALLSSEATNSLERSLLARLASVGASVLLVEFARVRPAGVSFLLSVGAMPEGGATVGDSSYRDFVRAVRDEGGFVPLFARYPVLARFVAITIDLWVDGTAEFLKRLHGDWNALAARFSTQPPQRVVAICANLSDAHNGGRTTIALTLDTGLRLLYKPKSVALERSYVELLTWCNRQGISLPFKTHAVLDCCTHGWAEFVAESPCDDEPMVARFYRRAGMQLGLLYALGASDCHAENLIACGEHLVLVDMETLLFPDPPGLSDEDESETIDSVFRTGLLPSWDCRYDTRLSTDVSGLGFEGSQTATRQWRFVNTDGMHIAWGDWPLPTSPNVPTLRGAPQSVTEHLSELTAGFDEMYRLLMRHRRDLLDRAGPIAALIGQPVRFIFRPTFVYAGIRERGLDPEYLESGLAYSVHLELLSHSLLRASRRPKAWPMLAAERTALEQLDVPSFGCRSDSATLSLGLPEPLEEYFRVPSYRECASRIERLSDTDLACQLEMIRGAMYCKTVGVHAESAATPASGHAGQETADRHGVRLTRSVIEGETQTIAAELIRRSIRGSRGEMDWLGVSYAHQAGRFQVRLMSDDLFDGRCGVALFLAAHAHVTEDRRSRETALQAFEPVRRRLRSRGAWAADEFGRTLPIGGAMGLGAILYSCARMSLFLDDPALLDDARAVGDLLTPERIEADRHLDVMGGAAGALLALLTMHGITGEPRFLCQATTCGERLVEARTWHHVSADGEYPKIGFGHGAAGIIYALVRLYAATHDPRFLRAAEQGRAYERGQFRLDGGTPTAVERGQTVTPGLVGSWCNGIPGMGLSRLGCASVLQDADTLAEIDAALAVTGQWPTEGVDHLCCGAAGRIEILLAAAEKLSDPRFRDVAHARATALIARARRQGGYRLHGGSLTVPLFKPSFFQGVAGIGYELLRLAHPEGLPSVLLWE